MKFIKTKLGKTLIIIISLLILWSYMSLVGAIKTKTLNKELTLQNEEFQVQNDNLLNEVDTLKKEVSKYKISIEGYADQIKYYEGELNTLKEQSGELVYLGKFTITHYCCEKYPHICGIGTGITASGEPIQAGVSIGVDPSKIPFGSKVYIEGYGIRISHDTGGAINGNHIDVAVESHEEALRLGTVVKDVWVIM